MPPKKGFLSKVERVKVIQLNSRNRNRSKIGFRAMADEKGNVDTTTIDDWKKKLPAQCEGYRPQDIFNMD